MRGNFFLTEYKFTKLTREVKASKKVTRIFRIDPKLNERLNNALKKDGLTLSSLLRSAIDAYLKKGIK